MARPTKQYQAFAVLTDRLLTVPRDIVQQRVDQERKMAAQNPKKRGPKPRATASGVGRESA